MKRQSLRIELRLDGELRAGYEGQYVTVAECGAEPPAELKPALSKPVRKDHNRGGRSQWTKSFFHQPGPELWQAIEISNRRD